MSQDPYSLLPPKPFPVYIPFQFNNPSLVPQIPSLVSIRSRQWFSITDHQQKVVNYLLCGNDSQIVSFLFFWYLKYLSFIK